MYCVDYRNGKILSAYLFFYDREETGGRNSIIWMQMIHFTNIKITGEF